MSTQLATGRYHVVQTRDPQLIDEICRFRVTVWRAENQLGSEAFPDGQWRDPVDDDSLHWLIRDEHQRLAAAARFSLHATLADLPTSDEYLRLGLELPGPIAAPDRVVVSRSARGAGLGRQLLDLQDAAAHSQGASHAIRQASPRMTQLLAHRGWTSLGPASADWRFPGVQFTVVLKAY